MELKIDTADVQCDAQLATATKGQIKLISQKDDIEAAYQSAHAHLKAVQARHAAELEQATQAWNAASRESSRAQSAIPKLSTTFRERPELFAVGCLVWPSVVTEPTPLDAVNPAIRFPTGVAGWAVEPVRDEAGNYVRNDRGAYLMPSGEYQHHS